MKIETAAFDKLQSLPLFPDHGGIAALLDSFELELVSCLFWTAGPSWRISTRTIGDSMLFVPVTGRIDVTCGDRQANAGPGQVVLFPEGVAHTARYSPGHNHLTEYALHFRYVDALGRQAFELFEDLAPKLPQAREWHRKLAVLTALFNRDRQAGISLGRVLVRAMMAELVMAGARLRRQDSRVDPRIVAALTRSAQSGAGHPSVEALAEHAGISGVQFRKLFRRALGVSPKQFLCRERLRAAADLLRRTEGPIKSIAAESGFSSDHYFERQFKLAYGLTPSAYRKRHRYEGV